MDAQYHRNPFLRRYHNPHICQELEQSSGDRWDYAYYGKCGGYKSLYPLLNCFFLSGTHHSIQHRTYSWNH